MSMESQITIELQVTEKETDGGIINEKGQTYCFYKDLC